MWFFFSCAYLDDGCDGKTQNNNHTQKHRQRIECIAYTHTQTHIQTSKCTVDSSFVGFPSTPYLFFHSMIRLLSQPDFYRILINFISIFMRLCRYKLWPLILILVRSFSLSLLTRNCISLCCIDNSLSHRFTSFHHKILLFNLKKKTSFCGWEHFEKVQTHVQCWRTNARGTEKQRDEEKTGVESFYFISINVHAV